ncbi:Hypothetical protein Nlim_1884 [Candidatus Nitrosarchaeum limnium SFB1]|jgi:hypothetical protein|uniref:DUF4760 domain-containing protein n=1 Tax=Candidatus Nitrosarchaeum limnium SFB1 TaxID=886738 RepID=F3KNA3_9ARCH|nr:Hypothetical protein Nlim_1884 [Candidatus Nitrosarchaeum limnium SFB1]
MTWHEPYLVIGTFLGIGLTFVAILITRYYQKKEYDRKGMLRIYDILSNEPNKRIRRRLYEAYCTGKIDSDGKLLDFTYNEDIEEVRTVFGEIGSLVQYGYVPKNNFLDAYAGVIIKTWKALEKNIERERQLRGTHRYMDSFESLYKDAKVHWKKQYYPDPDPEPCNKKTDEIMNNKK